MIYISGDIHGEKDRFFSSDIKKLKKNDNLIICGDFGFVWDGEKTEKKDIKWISKRKYKTLFVDGAYENFKLLNEYPIVDLYGGKARHLGKNLYYLLRGEVYEIEGKKFFTFGGGEKAEVSEIDLDKKEGALLEEQPSDEDMENGRHNLSKHGFEVDYIITHDITSRIKDFLNIKQANFNTLEFFLDEVLEKCKFKRWFFGHYHIDKVISPLYTAVFKNVIALDK